eukprot:3523383-Alexandrium_andersonii.AAC.1
MSRTRFPWSRASALLPSPLWLSEPGPDAAPDRSRDGWSPRCLAMPPAAFEVGAWRESLRDC